MRLARKKNQFARYTAGREEKSRKVGATKTTNRGNFAFTTSRLSGRPIVSNRRRPATSILLFRILRVAYKIDTNWKVKSTNTIETGKAAV